jgi:hypothetical protein
MPKTQDVELSTFTPSQLIRLLEHNIKHNLPTLIKGAPGIGKSDIVAQACRITNADLIISHPVISDPTDYKGLPFAANGEAMFLPFGDLKKLITATRLTVYFLDDLGQAPASVQAAVMQLILAREINGQKISDHVVFIAATNRKQDKAAVSGILEPVKSRFAMIVELKATANDWITWALTNNMPMELIAFIRFKPDLLFDDNPTKDIVNRPSPRTIAYVGKIYNSGMPADLLSGAFAGAAGDAFSTEFKGFLDVWANLPNIDRILMGGDEPAPTEAGVIYATIGALASRVNDVNCGNVFTFLEKMSKEVQYACVKDMVLRQPMITNTRAYTTWFGKHANFLMN